MTERTWLVGAGFLAVVVAYAVLSQLWVDSDAGWYESLRKPPWQPPDVVFGFIWPLNFLALAATGIVLAVRAPTRGAVVLAVLAVPWAMPLETADPPSATAIAQEQQPPAKEPAPEVHVNVDDGGEKRYVVWLSNPVLLAIGGVAIVVLVMLVAMASRGGTTVIKE